MSSYLHTFGGLSAAWQAMNSFELAYYAFTKACPYESDSIYSAVSCQIITPLSAIFGVALTHNAAAECIPPSSKTQRMIRLLSSSASFVAACITLSEIHSSSLPATAFKALIVTGSVVNGLHLLSQGLGLEGRPFCVRV